MLHNHNLFLNHVYAGHYVVICGYDADTDEFEIRDPASSRFVFVDLQYIHKEHSKERRKLITGLS